LLIARESYSLCFANLEHYISIYNKKYVPIQENGGDLDLALLFKVRRDYGIGYG